GIQGSYNLTQNFGLTGTFGWSPNKDQLLNDAKVDLFQYDLGIEGRLNNLTPTASISTRPYATLGAGTRTYHFRDIDAKVIGARASTERCIRPVLARAPITSATSMRIPRRTSW